MPSIQLRTIVSRHCRGRLVTGDGPHACDPCRGRCELRACRQGIQTDEILADPDARQDDI